jgi:hypothetical protein
MPYKNQEKQREANLRSKQKHRESIRKKAAVYREKNREQINAKQREKYAFNLEIQKARREKRKIYFSNYLKKYWRDKGKESGLYAKTLLTQTSAFKEIYWPQSLIEAKVVYLKLIRKLQEPSSEKCRSSS